HNPRAEETGEPKGRVPFEQTQDDVVAGRLLAQFVARLRRHRLTLSSKHAAGLLLGANLRHVLDVICHYAQKHTGKPNGQNAQRIKDYGFLEVAHLLRRQGEDENVWKRDRRKRDERIAEKVE